jgi:uncharacterized protein (DUF983 family)
MEGAQPIRERLRRVVRLVCPACGKGEPFESLLRMRRSCTVCGYRFERETGYFIGSIYFNYGVTAGSAVAGYLLLDALWALRFWQQMLIWVPWTLVLPFWFHRYARCLWMAVDHGVSPPVEADFVVRGGSGAAGAQPEEAQDAR